MYFDPPRGVILPQGVAQQLHISTEDEETTGGVLLLLHVAFDVEGKATLWQ